MILARPGYCLVRIAVCTIGIIAKPSHLICQDLPKECQALIDHIKLASGNPSLRQTQARVATVELGSHPECLVKELPGIMSIVAKPLVGSVLQNKTKQSPNRQFGAPGNVPGTTSAISQPFSAFSLASEYGGITTSSSAGTFTVQAALDQIPGTLKEDNVINPPEASLNFLQRISVGSTFTTSTTAQTVKGTATGSAIGNAQLVTATANGNSLPTFSAATIKVALLNAKADPGVNSWMQSVMGSADVTTRGKDLLIAASNLESALVRNQAFVRWSVCALKAIENATDENLNRVASAFYGYLKPILIDGNSFEGIDPETCHLSGDEVTPSPDPILVAALRRAYKDSTSFAESVGNLERSLRKPVLSVQYEYLKPQSQPTESVITLILSVQPQAKAAAGAPGPASGKASAASAPWTLTTNVGASIFNTLPSSNIPGASRLADVQAGAEWDYAIPSIRVLGQSTLGLVYYFQKQTSPSILKVTPGTPLPGITFTDLPSTATQVFTEKGDIHVAQVKWGFGVGKGVKFPLAFSYASRTDLVPKPDWRGELGVSWDFTSLTAPSGN